METQGIPPQMIGDKLHIFFPTSNLLKIKADPSLISLGIDHLHLTLCRQVHPDVFEDLVGKNDPYETVIPVDFAQNDTIIHFFNLKLGQRQIQLMQQPDVYLRIVAVKNNPQQTMDVEELKKWHFKGSEILNTAGNAPPILLQ